MLTWQRPRPVLAQGVLLFDMLRRHTGLSRVAVAYLGHCRVEFGSAVLVGRYCCWSAFACSQKLILTTSCV